MQEIIEYADKREYKKPDLWEAMAWVCSEIGEVYEVMLSKGGWVRNNPQDHPEKGDQELAEELGDVIFMIMLAGYSRGVNPLEAMKNKMTRKLAMKTVTGVSSVIPLTDKEAERIFKEVGDQEEERSED
jgi:NTP pyrophosphatase (non-canonical NTP hydrolase)